MYDTLQQEYVALKKEHNAARSDNEELCKQHASESKARDEEVKSLRKEMETIVAEKQRVEKTNARLQADVMQLTEERDNLRGNFQRLRVSCLFHTESDVTKYSESSSFRRTLVSPFILLSDQSKRKNPT